MDSSHFERASRVVRQSAVARGCRFVINWFRDAASQSAAAQVVHRVRDAVATVPIIERIRLAGVLVLTATLTHSGLLRLVPEMARPHTPWLRLEFAALGLVLIAAAAPIARAWPRSRLCALIARLRHLRAHA